jgi:glyoxylase-like metal-dependent hydrolase (beta-lactamase superfamily II)
LVQAFQQPGVIIMFRISRRDVVLSAVGAAAAFGLDKPLIFIGAAQAQTAPDAGKGFKGYTVGDIAMTSLWDGQAERKIDATYIKNASVDDVKATLTAAGLSPDAVQNPFLVPMAKIGGKTVLFDAGTGGQLAPTAGLMIANMKAAGVEPGAVNTILVSHFHPDHISGLMAKDTNADLFPNAEIVMPEAEYAWWTDAGVFTKLPEPRHGLAKRIQAVFPGWKDKGKIRLVGNDVEVIPGVRSVAAPGHTPGHTCWHVSSGKNQLFVLADAITFGPIFLKNPGWHVMFDADPVVAEASRRALLERAVAENAMITAYHFPFPGAGTVAKDGNGYALTPVV